MVLSVNLIFFFWISACAEGTGFLVEEKTVVRGNSLSISCTSPSNSAWKPIWLFDTKVIFTEFFQPSDIGIENVNGEMRDDSTSCLHIHQMTYSNVGNYTCLVRGNVTVMYILHVRDSVLYMLCEGEECPLTEHLDAPSLYMFQCYIDYNMPNSSFVWKVDGMETTEGVESIQFHLKTNETELLVPSSVLTVSLQRYVAVSCSLGNLSKVVHIAVEQLKQTVTDVAPGTDIVPIALSGLVCVVIACITIVCLYNKCRVSRGEERIRDKPKEDNRQRENRRSFAKNDIQLADGIYDDTNSFYGSFAEYDDIDKPDEGLNKVFPRESISFRIEIQATTIQRWRGTLSSSGNKLQEIMISYIATDAADDAKQLWQNCSHAKLALPEHENILTTLGYCKDGGILHILQDDTQMSTLDFRLISEHTLDNEENQSLFYAHDILKGMEFLVANQLSHPGLSAKRVHVTKAGVCKLHDFCPTNDAEMFVETLLQDEDDTQWIFEKEYVTPLNAEYNEGSDVWFIGIILWEIFFGGLDSLRALVKLDEADMREQIEAFKHILDWPEEKFSVMKLCLSRHVENRPSISRIRQIITSNRERETKNTMELIYSKEEDTQSAYYQI
ncbi:uncharacterized protein [Apostichopus japonicus]|uniref:uncharacterized protein isoform X2 n=1 Tax=Stichopus japonicus TaxID=307972 RepID=UPI003AB7A868